MNHRLSPKGIEPSSTDLEVLTTVGGKAGWAPLPAAPPAPVPSYREVVMESGVTPPTPLLNSEGTDWIYGVVEL